MELTFTALQLYLILKEKSGEKEAEALVNFIVEKLKEDKEKKLKAAFAEEQDRKNKIKMAESKLEKFLFGFFVALMLAIVGLYFKK